MRASTLRSRLTAILALAALAAAPAAIAEPKGNTVEHRIELTGQGLAFMSDDEFDELPYDPFTCVGELSPVHGKGWLLHPGGTGRFQLNVSPGDFEIDDDGFPRLLSSRVGGTLAIGRGELGFGGTLTWSGAGLSDYYYVQDSEAEFSGTLAINGGSGDLEGASGDLQVRGHLESLGSWGNWAAHGTGSMRLDEVTLTIRVPVP